MYLEKREKITLIIEIVITFSFVLWTSDDGSRFKSVEIMECENINFFLFTFCMNKGQEAT